MNMFKLVSIIMPVFNGEKYIERSIHAVSRFLEHYGFSFEVIVVDDGSTDETKSCAEKAASSCDNVRIVGYNENRGKGAAFLYGYRHSRGDVIILFDSDLDIPPPQIPLLLAVMKRTGTDIVVTNKWHPLSRIVASPPRKLLSRSFNVLVKLITGLSLDDTQTGAKAIKRYVLDTIVPKMFAKRYVFDVELLLLAVKHGYKIAEVPSLKPIMLTTAFKPREIFYMFLEQLSIVYRHGRLQA